MAAPSDLRVEANSLSSTTLYWVYAGTATIAVFRSTDGSSYAEITEARVALGTLTYNDTGLAAGTKYWYKTSDDAGSTFSSVVTVWTHGCVAVATGGDGFSLPRFGDGSEPMPMAIDHGDPDAGVTMMMDEMVEMQAKLDETAQRIEDTLQGRLLDPAECAVCPEDGAIIINCSDGCRDFVVIADEDINSISINMCDEGEGNIEFIVPPNVTRRICGWPNGFGFGGDECFRAPIVAGSAGRSMNVPFASSGRGGGRGLPKSRPGYGKGVGRGGGGGGGIACPCVPGKQGQLTIKSCNANNSLDCDDTKTLKLLACGGKFPYFWSKTGTVVINQNSDGSRCDVTPPANAGSAVGGIAWRHDWWSCIFCTAGVCTTCGSPVSETHGCDDAGVPGCTITSSCADGTTCAEVPHEGPAICTGAGNSGKTTTFCGNTVHTTHLDKYCDVRTAPMIAAGCAPCGVSAIGATVTVTDAVGVQTTIILTA